MTDSSPDRRRRSSSPWGLGYWPLALPFMLALILVGGLVFVFVSIAGYTFERIGIGPGWLFGILCGSILGSWINIPVARFHARRKVENVDVTVFGVRYRVPVQSEEGKTVLAVNVGGALIPTALASYLVVADGVWLHALIGTAIITVLMKLIARPVKGVGIVTPALIPPLLAAGTAIALGGHKIAAVAYVAGTLGTLLGADILNIPRIRDLGAPVASIGGAGTFDGVFLTGILAAVLATI